MGRGKKSLSLEARGARYQFVVGVSLLAVIPLLTVWYLMFSGLIEVEMDMNWRYSFVGVLVVGIAMSGYMILRSYPENITRLRNYMKDIVEDELPEELTLENTGDDFTAIEDYMNTIVSRLRERYEMMQTHASSLEKQLFQAQKMESLGLLAGHIAHDFGNLLTSILGNATMAIDDADDTSLVTECMEDVKAAVNQAQELINQLLTYSGQGDISTLSIDICELIRGMQKLIGMSVSKQVTVNYDLPEGLPQVRGDSTQLKQVIMNLAINASEAMNGTVGEIYVKLSKIDSSEIKEEGVSDEAVGGFFAKAGKKDFVCMEVSDTAGGMDSETLAKICDPFYTTKKSGRGLGLAVVFGIIKRHGGVLTIESEKGKGSRFRTSFPSV